MTAPLFKSDVESAVRYFSLARYALGEALHLAGIGAGKRVLLPEFVCRDLLAPLSSKNIEPRWHAIGAGLSPATHPDEWPEAEAVLAINYFGFPQDLTPYDQYAARTGALVIEDNAHGYLSRDVRGQWLGSRTRLGLLSLRKTLRVPDGAALIVNDRSLSEGLPEALPFDGRGVNRAQLWKSKMRCCPIVGEVLFRTSVLGARAVRKWRSGSSIPVPSPLSETEISAGPNPWSGLLPALAQLDADAEINRRRSAYLRCAMSGDRCGVLPVFRALPDNCAPYGFPFRGGPEGRAAMQGVADQMGFDLVSWPDLPNAVEPIAPSYYRDVFLINFLW